MGTSALAMMSVSDDPALQLLAALRFAADKVPKAPPVAAAHDDAAAQRPHPHRLPVGRPAHARRGPADARAARAARPPALRGLGLRLDARVATSRSASGCCRPSTTMCGWPAWTTHRGALIAQAGIDVLVDLQGLTNGARPAILGHRAGAGAGQLPRAARHLGLPGVDWMLADRYVMPPELLPYCTERPLLRAALLPGQRPPPRRGAAPERSTYGLPDDAFVFCSFNNNFKFSARGVRTPGCASCRQVPGSVLWLLADNDTARENMLAPADAHAAWRRERLIFAPRVSPAEYLARFQLRRPGARHLPVQRRHHRQRRAVDGHAHRHAQRPHLHLAHGRQPAHRGGPARPGHRPRWPTTRSWPSRWAASRRAWPRTSATWPNRAARRRCSTMPQLVRDIEAAVRAAGAAAPRR
jgi:hypothetical protein